MRTYRLEHLSDTDLLRGLRALVAQDRITTAVVLAHIAEVDSRRLYLPAGFPSMFEYCVQELRLSEQAAMKRIRAGRTARRFPVIFQAVAEGRLHLSSVVLLTPHLTRENAGELLAEAESRTRAELELLLARRFPRPDVPARLEAIAPAPWLTPGTDQVSPGTVQSEMAQVSPGTVQSGMAQVSPGTVGALPLAGRLAAAQGEAPVSPPRVKPVSAERFAVQFTIGRGTHDKLRRVQALVSHELPSGDIAEVFDRALDALTDRLEKRKFAATTRPRPRPGHSTANPRRIPAHVKRAVWERDRGQCTFVGATGHRCSARGFLEYDHVEPVARGGQATVANLRLRCSPHNQFEAERLLGAGFMNGKRAGASRAAAETGALKIGPEACARAAAAARSPAAVAEARAREQAADTRAGARPVASEAHADAVAQLGDLKTVLREFGFRADEVRRAIEFCANLGDVMLEEQVRAALRLLCPKARVQGPVGAIPVMAT